MAKTHRSFNYALQPAELRDWLQEAAEVFEARPESAIEAVSTGSVLAEAKTRLDHGSFGVWCETESSWHPRTIQRLLSSAFFFGSAQIRQLAVFDRAALYTLAQRRLPDAARQTAIAEADAGKRITYSRARQIAGLYVLALAPPIQQQAAAEQKPAAAVSPLAALLEQYDSIHVHVVRDQESGDVSIYGEAIDSVRGKRTRASRDEPDLLVQSLAGVEPVKWCSACKVEHPLGLFSVDQRRADGKAAVCRQSERSRQKKYSRQRQEKRAAAKPTDLDESQPPVPPPSDNS